jgi:aryl-alcohol dehydrogenase-like predicted oxidoreductase
MTRKAAAKLGLGVAQIGADPVRGAAAELRRMLQAALAAGIGLVDASGGPEVQAIAAAALPRPHPFRLFASTTALHDGIDAVEARLRQSLRTFAVDALDALLVRNGADLVGPEGCSLWERLKRLKDAGLVRRIGVAAEPGEDALGLARRFKPDMMQLSASLLDQRLIQDGALGEIAAQGVEVVLRSGFLHGLSFLPQDATRQIGGAGPRLSRLRRNLAEAGADPLQASLAFALARPEASAVMVDARSLGELNAVLAAAAAPAPQLDWGAFALDNAAALDSRCWVAA